MPWNGSGVAAPPGADYPAVSLTTISAAVRNALDSDIYTCLTNCITKDGQSVVSANIPMAGFKITGLAQGTAATDAATIANANSYMCEFRLSMVSGAPADPVGNSGTTLYCTPYKGNHIALFNGSVWIMRASAEFSLALSGMTPNKPYDVFCYDNVGVPTLEILVWTNDTTRATALTTQDGVLVKTGALTRRYLGTFYAENATTTEDTAGARYLWNYYNRVARRLARIETNGSWTYTTATIRQAGASANNQVVFIIGVSEDPVTAELAASASNTNANIEVRSGLGLDSTSAFSGQWVDATTAAANNLLSLRSTYRDYPGIGRHFLSWNEYSAATGTTTWIGTNPGTLNNGITGHILG